MGVAVVNYFPVKTVVDGVVWRTCKVDTRDGLVRVWVVDKKLPKLLGVWPVEQVTLSDRRGELAVTADGVVFRKGGGCGCSHALKHFVPPVSIVGVERV